MTARVLAETAVALVIALVLTLLFCGLLDLADGTDPATAFFDSAPRMVFVTLWPTLIIWTVLALIVGSRNRHRKGGAKFAAGVMITIAACLLTVGGWLVFAMVVGGWAFFFFAIALVPTVFFFVSAVLASLVTHLGIFRQRLPGA